MHKVQSRHSAIVATPNPTVGSESIASFNNMSAGTKHARDDGEEQAARQPKKAKTDSPEAAADVKPKKTKKEKNKKEKKANKEKKDKDSEGKGHEDEDQEVKVPEVKVPEVKDPEDKNQEDKEEKKKTKKEKKKEKKEKKYKKQPKESILTPTSTSDASAEPEQAELESTEPESTESTEPKQKKEKKEKKDKKEKKQKNKVASEVSDHTLDNTTEEHTPGSYKQAAALDAVPETEIQAFLSKEEISVSDPSATSSSAATFRPLLRFDFLPRSTLISKKPFATFTAPTPIQSASWPFALSGRDVIGVAETGSGKTLAFSLPCVEALFASSTDPSPYGSNKVTHARAVIVSPTRELAMQTHASISTLAALVGLSAVCIYGGASKDDQRTLLRRNKGADIIVATPGRLKDFMSEGCVSLSKAKFVVLDEADRMLDKGFEEDIKMILSDCPPREQRQTLMFTATWPASVRGLAEGFMVNPVKITIGGKPKGDGDGGEDDGVVELQANNRITQKVEVIDPRSKEQRVYQLVREAQQGKAKNDRVLVFCLYKKEAVRVEQSLQWKGISVASIHGDLKQEQRTRSLEAFKAGTTTVLVATDVAARGLDIPEVKLVINVTVRPSLSGSPVTISQC